MRSFIIEHRWARQWLWRRLIFVILDAWVSRQAVHLNKRITNDGRSLTNRRRSTIGNILFESTGTRGKWWILVSVRRRRCADPADASWMFNVVPLTVCIQVQLQLHRAWKLNYAKAHGDTKRLFLFTAWIFQATYCHNWCSCRSISQISIQIKK